MARHRTPIHKLADDAVYARFRVTAPATKPLVPITAVVRRTPQKEPGYETYIGANGRAYTRKIKPEGPFPKSKTTEAKKDHVDGASGRTTEKVSWPLKAPKVEAVPKGYNISVEYQDKRGRWRAAKSDGKLPEVNVQITACRITAPQMRLVEKVAVSKADWAALQTLIRSGVPNKAMRRAMLACRGDVITVQEPNTMPLRPVYPKGKM